MDECCDGALLSPQIGNLQAVAQFLSNFTKSASGTLGDLLSPARMVIFGTLLTTLNKPMFAASGWVYASYGTVATVYWVTFAKVQAAGDFILQICCSLPCLVSVQRLQAAPAFWLAVTLTPRHGLVVSTSSRPVHQSLLASKALVAQPVAEQQVCVSCRLRTA